MSDVLCGLSEPVQQIAIGQILLAIACVFYMLWWTAVFYPNASEKRRKLGKIPWLFLWIYACIGLILIAQGLVTICELSVGAAVRNSSVVAESVTEVLVSIAAGGIILYILLVLATTKLFKRKLTAELSLIVIWMSLELMIFEALRVSRLGAWNMTFDCLATIAFATVDGVACYLLYSWFKHPPLVFFSGLVPPGVNAVAMIALTCWMVP